MTERQIELIVEQSIDFHDYLLLKGYISQQKYDEEISLINKWAERRYKKLSKTA